MIWSAMHAVLPAVQYGPMHGPGSGWGGGWHVLPFGGLGWLIIVGLGILVVVALLRRGGSPQRPAHEETPLGILKKRYAKGELTREEFQEMKKEIESR